MEAPPAVVRCAAWLMSGSLLSLTTAAAQPVDRADRMPVISAVPATSAIDVDGRLDDPDWHRVLPITSFTQVEPIEGRPASERTEVRVVFDDRYLYFGVVCHDSGGDLRVRDLRRDFDDTTDDFFGISIDGVGDGRSALVFRVNARGALRDQQTVDGGLADVDFDAVWIARTARQDDGWTAEVAIPWQSLRYRIGQEAWGLNFQRVIRRKNENVGWSPWPRALQPFRMDYAGRLTGLQPPPPGRNLRLQPYALVEAVDGAARGSGDRFASGRIGTDIKWAVKPSAVLDLTVNPDFGQADVDRQVVNLTRFSVFFPERRPFFLENRGVFFTGNGQRLEPFFSRRIGLDNSGEPIPIIAGGRYSVRAPGGAFGALFAAQREGDDGTPASRFGVLRYVANFGAQNRLGALLTTRADADGRTNVVAGPDWFWRPSPSSFVRGTLTGSTTSGDGGEGLGGYIWVANEARWGYVGYISELVTRAYEARSGFILRNDYVRISPAATLDWRPAWRPSWVRRFQPGFTLEHYVGASDGRVQEGFLSLRPMTIQFEHGGTLQYALQPNWQRLRSPFRPVPGVSVPPGDYDYIRHLVTLQSDPSARLAVRVETGEGGYFDGSLSALRLALQVTPDPRAAFSVDYTLNRLSDVGGATGAVSTHLLATEARLAANPRVQFVAFAQWNTVVRQASVNARFSWEYRPLAFFTIVYNDRSPISGLGLPAVAPPGSRQLLVKLGWLSQL